MSKNQLSTQPYKGTRDFYPEDMQIRQYIFGGIRNALQSQGYLEYDGPMLEPFELYASKTSEEIVNEQLYWLIDRGERKLAIRPEMTPTLARMVAAKQNELAKPIRWFSIPNLWRYERPQRGRLREHWQLNVDVFGGNPLAEDLEICQIIPELMSAFGATPEKKMYEVRINHRGLIDAIFGTLAEIPTEKQAQASHLLDAAPKMGEKAFEEALKKDGFSDRAISVLLSLLKPDASERLRKDLSENPHFQHLEKLLHSLERLGLRSLFRYDPSIMRGFLYYTGVVFEVFDLHPENNRALFGGGRYDNLVGAFQGAPLPGVGFGMGDVTFRNFLESHGLLPSLKQTDGIYVAALDEATLVEAQVLSRTLRNHLRAPQVMASRKESIPVLCGLSPEKPKKAFVSAERLGARAIVFVGPDDVARAVFPMKDTKTQTQFSGTAAELSCHFAGLLLKNSDAVSKTEPSE